MSRLPLGLRTRESWQIMFTKDKLLWSPYARQGQWMWFLMTRAYQNTQTMTDISCCDFDTSLQALFWWCQSSGRPAVTGPFRWRQSTREKALKRLRRGLSPLGKAIMTLLSPSMSIVIQRPSISNHIQTFCQWQEALIMHRKQSSGSAVEMLHFWKILAACLSARSKTQHKTCSQESCLMDGQGW